MFVRFAKHATRLLLPGLAAWAATAAAAPVQFTADPASGHAWIIPQHFFRICQLRHIDPWTDACPNWRPVANGRAIELQGIYCVFGTWGDSNRFHGILVVSPGSGPRQYQITQHPVPSGQTC